MRCAGVVLVLWWCWLWWSLLGGYDMVAMLVADEI